MDSAFRPDQHAFFEEHGWLVLRGVVSGQPLTRMTEAFDEALRPHLEGDMPCDERGRSIWQVPGMCCPTSSTGLAVWRRSVYPMAPSNILRPTPMAA